MCTSRTVASSGQLSIQTCDSCNTISLTIGPLMMRLEPHALHTLKDVINRAVGELNRENVELHKLAH